MDSFKEFIERWSTPTAYAIILGGIIWGVQLNFAVLELTKELAINRITIQQMKTDAHSIAVINARTTAVLEALIRQVDGLESRMTRNEANISDNARKGE